MVESKINFVYVLNEGYDNEESYEDHYWTDNVLGVFSTFEKAREAMLKQYDNFIKDNDVKKIYSEYTLLDDAAKDMEIDLHRWPCPPIKYIHNYKDDNKHITWSYESNNFSDDSGYYDLSIREVELDKIISDEEE